MYRLGNFLYWLVFGLTAFFVFYGFVLFLPIILMVVAGYLLLFFIKYKFLQRKFNEKLYAFGFERKNRNDDNVIDAEFEIVEEKMYK